MANNEILKDLLKDLDQALENMQQTEAQTDQAGLVKFAKDGVIEIKGLPDLSLGEVVFVDEAEVNALVLQVEKQGSLAVILEPDREVKTGQAVRSTGRFLSIPVSEGLIGRVVDPLGQALDEGEALPEGETRPLESGAPSVMERQPVSEAVQTGIVAIDALIPIGRGQRELIIGDRQTGKTTVALDTILSQKGQDMVCVYVSVGQRDSKTAQVIQTLKEHGALDYTVVVSASAASSAVLQYLSPYAGVAIAEYFMAKGRDVLVVYDDLSKHAVAYREMSLLLRKPPGREAYPGDVFYIHSRLLERAARLNEEKGGGSITALPIIETLGGDVSAYIPTNVISITDGQIFLESDLFYRGIRPAINIGISVSRVGSAAQTKIMKKVAGTAKLDLAQYYELADFAQFASELDASSLRKLTRGERVVEALKQKPFKPRSLWQEVVVLWAGTRGYLDSIPLTDVTKRLASVLDTFEVSHKELIAEINQKKELTEKIAGKLDKVMSELFPQDSK